MWTDFQCFWNRYVIKTVRTFVFFLVCLAHKIKVIRITFWHDITLPDSRPNLSNSCNCVCLSSLIKANSSLCANRDLKWRKICYGPPRVQILTKKQNPDINLSLRKLKLSCVA